METHAYVAIFMVLCPFLFLFGLLFDTNKIATIESKKVEPKSKSTKGNSVNLKRKNKSKYQCLTINVDYEY